MRRPPAWHRTTTGKGGQWKVARIYRYPIKGLSAEPLHAVEVAVGEGLPPDRNFALARPDAPFDPSDPPGCPTTGFLMLRTV
jgi:uncharacterized protein